MLGVRSRGRGEVCFHGVRSRAGYCPAAVLAVTRGADSASPCGQLDTEYRKKWDSLVIKLDVIERDLATGSEVIHWVTHFPVRESLLLSPSASPPRLTSRQG